MSAIICTSSSFSTKFMFSRVSLSVIFTNGTLAKIPRDFLFNLYSSLRVPFRDEDIVHVINPTNGAIFNVNVTDEPQGRFFNGAPLTSLIKRSRGAYGWFSHTVMG